MSASSRVFHHLRVDDAGQVRLELFTPSGKVSHILLNRYELSKLVTDIGVSLHADEGRRIDKGETP